MSIRIIAIRLAAVAGREQIAELKHVNELSGVEGVDTRAAVIAYIEDGGAVVAGVGESRSRVHVVSSANGTKHLRTTSDGTDNNNLLSLPRF